MGKTVRDVQVTVPVLGLNAPLMPCHPARARQLKKKGAKVRWFKGIYVIQMDKVSTSNTQQVVCGVDPGFIREAFTVQSKKHTYLNVLSDGINHVQRRMVVRKEMRRTRRRRKTPCRPPRFRRRPKKSWIAPSIKSRWEAKLRIINFLGKLYPITDYVVEDVRARKYKNMKKWNKIFSNLETGKFSFYDKISRLGHLVLKRGFETASRREALNLKKGGNKRAEKFKAHNVDSWVLASFVTGKSVVDNKEIFRMIPLKFVRRQLHKLSPHKGNVRHRYGGTTYCNQKKGSFVKHSKFGFLYIGGFPKAGIVFNNPSTGELERIGDMSQCTFLYHSGWRTNWVGQVIHNQGFVGGHSLRDPDVRKRGQETKIRLYGDKNFTNRDKSKSTCLERYGVDNVAKVKGFKQLI